MESLQRAHSVLSSCVSDAHQDEKSDLAIIKAFEMAFELAWKTLQDVLSYEGISTLGARSAIKAAFGRGLVSDGRLWLKMLDQRNTLVHVYDAQAATEAVDRIREKYFGAVTELVTKLQGYAKG